VGAYYERAAVVCVPSRREGYGITAREAMAHRRALVATDVGGLADAAKDGVTALVVPPADPAAIRTAVERLFADAQLRTELAGRAHAAAVEEFSPGAETRALAEAYSAALS
jgi:glycosyltransferase involved in cell wall biosynthesis